MKSFKEAFLKILSLYIADPKSHARWLNTLSYLENCGAKKIAKTEHPIDVSKEMLKHASEEFRHAFYLKQQITTRLGIYLPTYQKDKLWGSFFTFRYLDRLEVKICRLLKQKLPRLNKSQIQQHTYLLVTYAIELRAAELYPIYQDLLIQTKSPVSVRSILLDEKGHLEEMEKELAAQSISKEIQSATVAIESELCKTWLEKLLNQIRGGIIPFEEVYSLSQKNPQFNSFINCVNYK